MQVTDVRLVNFRNYASLSLHPDSGLCVLTGENAAGKTNVLESIFLCALGRSHRTSRDAELIREGEEGAYVGLTLRTLGGTRSIEARLRSGERKKLAVDGAPLTRSGELMGCLNVVMFAPEDLQLVKDGPAERRRFLDMEISQRKPKYYYALQQYNLALRQRNALLKDTGMNVAPGAIDPWNEQLAVLGAGIALERAEHAARLSDVARTLHETLSDGQEQLTLTYQPNLPLDDPTRVIDAARVLLEQSVERDVYRGFTTVGPHRDDLGLSLNGRDARVYGSQGQQRTVVLSMKLAELEILRQDRGEPPVLLLDDVFSELDKRRQQMLVIAVQGCQTFLTCTHLEELAEAGAERMQVYSVQNGDIFEVE